MLATMAAFKYVVLLLVLAATLQVMLAQRRPRVKSRRLNDNPDIGLPSGRDWPDGRRRRLGAASAPAATNNGYRPATAPAATNNGYRPPTSGGRFNDNPDIGLPSGRDWPDGRRRRLGAATAPAATNNGYRPATAPSASNNGYRPATATNNGYRPATAPAASNNGYRPMTSNNGYRSLTRGGRFNDNPDFGLPSGRDWPDARRRPYATAPIATNNGYRPAATPVAANNWYTPVATNNGYRSSTRGGIFNDNPDFGLPSGRDWPDARRRPLTAGSTAYNSNGGYNSQGGYYGSPYSAMTLFGGIDTPDRRNGAASNNQCSLPKTTQYGQCSCCPRNVGCNPDKPYNSFYDECDSSWEIACCAD